MFAFVFVACGNKTKNVNVQSDANDGEQVASTLVASSTPSEMGEKAESSSSVNSNWNKKYFTDEFGDDDPSQPFIEQGWDGQRNQQFDSRMLIRISTTYGLQFGIIEDYHMAELSGLRITGQFNGNKFEIPYDDVSNGAVTITDMNVIRDFIGILDSEGTLKLSFYREDSFGAPQNRVFTILVPTGVKKALAGIGIEVGYNSKYDDHGDAPEEESYDPTKEDPNVLMNRVIEE